MGELESLRQAFNPTLLSWVGLDQSGPSPKRASNPSFLETLLKDL